jgi:prolyl-tRNA editing enzyme YbaK/EbsC (Cys-tRNA(Pro) deacylase)
MTIHPVISSITRDGEADTDGPCRNRIPGDVLRALARHGLRLTACPPAACTSCLTKSLLACSRRDSAVAIVVCAKAEKVDLHSIARLLGWHRARLATPLEVMAFLRAHQQAFSPITHDGQPVLIDSALECVDRVLVNASADDVYLDVSVADLLSMTHGTCARVVLPRWRWE